MLAASVRSGLVETVHEGAVAVADPDGSLIAWYGDIDRPFYLRSAAKPFQAHVVQEAGAELVPVELAMASASHDGNPAQVALVESMLDRADSSPEDLRCPADWPLGQAARRAVLRTGEIRPRRIWHNCSGKHASFLRACRARDWPADSYLDPNHPLQTRIVELVSELGGHPVTPVGVDGCGAPALRTTTRILAILYARLATDDELRGVFDVMHRYPRLVSGVGNPDASIAITLNAVAKRGAEGCLGVGLDRRLGIGVKSWEGSGTLAGLAAIAALDALGELTAVAGSSLATHAQPIVRGGGVPVGSLEPRFELNLN